MGHLEIKHIVSTEGFDALFHASGLYDVYEDCFSRPPYEEHFAPEDVYRAFRGYIAQGILLLCLDSSTEKCVGFLAAIPLRCDAVVAAIARQHGFAPEDWWYIADFGIREAYRRRGLSGRLHRELVGRIPSSRILTRTQEHNIASQEAHRKAGYQRIEGMVQLVRSPRISGKSDEDRRIFMQYTKQEHPGERGQGI